MASEALEIIKKAENDAAKIIEQAQHKAELLIKETTEQIQHAQDEQSQQLRAEAATQKDALEQFLLQSVKDDAEIFKQEADRLLEQLNTKKEQAIKQVMDSLLA